MRRLISQLKDFVRHGEVFFFTFVPTAISIAIYYIQDITRRCEFYLFFEWAQRMSKILFSPRKDNDQGIIPKREPEDVMQ
jgi:hypothetical protein